MLKIGSFVIDPPVILAPMAGVTDRPFRKLCISMGAGMAVSEMLTSNSDLWHTRKSQLRMTHTEEQEPRSVQIVGNDPKKMAQAAQMAHDLGAQIIDINMGCPAKKVCNKAVGSALLKDPDLVESILVKVVESVNIPVTLKIRTGWSPENKNAVQIATIAQNSGIQALTIHGRTRQCFYKGVAEYETIRQVCQVIDIPVIANGDIQTPEQAKFVLDKTGASAVMIGRAAQGMPWLFKKIAHYLQSKEMLPDPSIEQIKMILMKHLEELHEFYGELQGMRIARKHVGWYLKNVTNGSDIRQRFNQLESASQQKKYLDNCFDTISTM